MTNLLTNKFPSFCLMVLILSILAIGEMTFIAPIFNAFADTLSKCDELGIVSAFEYRTADDSMPYYRADSDLYIYSGSSRVPGNIILVNKETEYPIIHFSQSLQKRCDIRDDGVTYLWGGESGVMTVGAPIPSLKLLSKDSSLVSSDIMVIEGLPSYILDSPRRSYEVFDDNWSGLVWGNSVLTSVSQFRLYHYIYFTIYIIVRTLILVFLCLLFERVGLMNIGGYFYRLKRIGVSSIKIGLHYLIEIISLGCIPILLMILIGSFNFISFPVIAIFSTMDFISFFLILKILGRRTYGTC